MAGYTLPTSRSSPIPRAGRELVGHGAVRDSQLFLHQPAAGWSIWACPPTDWRLNPVAAAQSAGRGYLGDAHHAGALHAQHAWRATCNRGVAEAQAVRAFQHLFRPRAKGELPTGTPRCAWACSATDVDFYTVKETRWSGWLATFGVTAASAAEGGEVYYHPGRQAVLTPDGEQLLPRWARSIPTWPRASASTAACTWLEVDLHGADGDGQAHLRREGAAHASRPSPATSPSLSTKATRRRRHARTAFAEGRRQDAGGGAACSTSTAAKSSARARRVRGLRHHLPRAATAR